MSAHVYIVRPGDKNDELRYSLRSLEQNVDPDAEVWVVGYTPSWLQDVESVDGNPTSDKPQNVYANVRLASQIAGTPDELTIWNDDFIALSPVQPAMAYRGSLEDHIASLKVKNWWWRSLDITRTWLSREQGLEQPLSYELHRPFPINRHAMAQVLEEAQKCQPSNPPQWRTLYGNRWEVPAELSHDGKVYGVKTPIPAGPWMSTTDKSFTGSVRDLLAAQFPEPSRWEATWQD